MVERKQPPAEEREQPTSANPGELPKKGGILAALLPWLVPTLI